LKDEPPHPSDISVVDDDESVRESLQGLLKSVGYSATTFGSAEAFLASDAPQNTKCLILDMRMPGMSGLDLKRELAASRQEIPIVFISAHCEPALRSRAIAEGAIDCLHKPFGEQELLTAVNRALVTPARQTSSPSEGEQSTFPRSTNQEPKTNPSYENDRASRLRRR
jgi:FixJ family two-component response regulator